MQDAHWWSVTEEDIDWWRHLQQQQGALYEKKRCAAQTELAAIHALFRDVVGLVLE